MGHPYAVKKSALALQDPITATIPNGSTTSNTLDLNGSTVAALEFPATMTGTAVSFLAKQASGDTFRNLYGNDGAAVSYTVVNGRLQADVTDFIGIRFLQIVSNATEAADRAIKVIFQDV